MYLRVKFSRHNSGDTTLNILWVFIYNFFFFCIFSLGGGKKDLLNPSRYPPSHSPRYSGSTSGSFHYELLFCYYALLSTSCFENRENLQFFVLIEVGVQRVSLSCLLLASLTPVPALPPPLFSFFLSSFPSLPFEHPPQLGVWTVCE